MLAALDQARLAAEIDEVPVGAVVVKGDQIISRGFNKNISLKDPTAHAEVLVLRAAAESLQSHRLDECDLYVTLEPCLMCATAISLARIRRIYYAAADHKFGAIESGLFSRLPKCYHRPEIYSGFLQDVSAELLQEFFRKKR